MVLKKKEFKKKNVIYIKKNMTKDKEIVWGKGELPEKEGTWRIARSPTGYVKYTKNTDGPIWSQQLDSKIFDSAKELINSHLRKTYPTSWDFSLENSDSGDLAFKIDPVSNKAKLLTENPSKWWRFNSKALDDIELEEALRKMNLSQEWLEKFGDVSMYDYPDSKPKYRTKLVWDNRVIQIPDGKGAWRISRDNGIYTLHINQVSIRNIRLPDNVFDSAKDMLAQYVLENYGGSGIMLETGNLQEKRLSFSLCDEEITRLLTGHARTRTGEPCFAELGDRALETALIRTGLSDQWLERVKSGYESQALRYQYPPQEYPQ